MKYSKNIHKNERGLVSIAVAMVVMGVLTLITVSFAFLVRREQRQALDRQLSTQAFYAAETGVNDAIDAIKDGRLNGDVTDCSTAQQNRVSPLTQRQLDSRTGVEYTCVLVDQSPTSFEKSPVSVEEDTVVRIRSAGGTIKRLRISWQAENADAVFNDDDHHFLPQDAARSLDPNNFSNHTGILRASIMPVSTFLTRASLTSEARSYFLYPRASTTANTHGSQNYGSNRPNDNGVFINGDCNTGNSAATTPDHPKFCNAEITHLGSLNTHDVYLRLRSIYKPSSVTVQMYDTDGGQTPQSIIGAQAVIDATGKANDVLRRIRVAVPLTDEYRTPKFAIESMDTICKRLLAWKDGALLENVVQGGPPNTIDYDQSIDFGTAASEVSPTGSHTCQFN